MPVRPLRLIVPLAVCAALLVGCGDDDPEASPTAGTPSATTESSATDPTSGATSDSSTSEPVDPSADPSDPSATGSAGPTEPVPADAEELCGVFSTAYESFVAQSGSMSSDEAQPLAKEFVDALHTWGEGLADAERPSSLSDDEKTGLDLMSRLLGDIPDDATGKDLATLDEELSDGDNDKVEAASEWVDETCNLDLS